MKKILINYANDRFESVRKLNTWTGSRIAGFDKVIEYGPEQIDQKFFEENREILEEKRGNGLWLWKPYFIRKALLEEADDGDFLFYCDSGAFFIRSIEPILQEMKGDLWISELPLIEKQWTKKTVLKRLCENRSDIGESNQIQASFLLIRKTEASTKLIEEWLKLCCEKSLLEPLKEGEQDPDCISHREDQSILSVLCKLHGIVPQKDPSQFGRFPEEYRNKDYLYREKQYENSYQITIILHRLDYIRIRAFVRFLLAAWLPYPLAKKCLP